MITVWDRRFLDQARQVAGWSKDPSTKVGAVLADSHHHVLSVGYNGFPACMSDDTILYENRDEKISRIIHAEMNALLHHRGPMPPGATLYTWPLPPCDRCMVHLLQVGLRRIVTVVPDDTLHRRWADSLRRAHRYLTEAGGTIAYVHNQDTDSLHVLSALPPLQPSVVE